MVAFELNKKRSLLLLRRVYCVSVVVKYIYANSYLCFTPTNGSRSNWSGFIEACQYFWNTACKTMLVNWLIKLKIKSKFIVNIPCDTNNCRDMSQGLTPINANSTILLRTQSGSGRPLTNTPPNWLTPAWPAINNQSKQILNYQKWSHKSPKLAITFRKICLTTQNCNKVYFIEI